MFSVSLQCSRVRRILKFQLSTRRVETPASSLLLKPVAKSRLNSVNNILGRASDISNNRKGTGVCCRHFGRPETERIRTRLCRRRRLCRLRNTCGGSLHIGPQPAYCPSFLRPDRGVVALAESIVAISRRVGVREARCSRVIPLDGVDSRSSYWLRDVLL